MFPLLSNYNLDDQVKEDEMGRACVINMSEEEYVQGLVGKPGLENRD
jgi:hypothetical protein